MGKLNLLKGAFSGKVGQTVGADWKGIATIRTYTIPTDPKTEDQTTIRTVFGEMNAFVARFSDAIKYLTALRTKGESVRNAIVSMNKAQFEAGAFDKTTLQISKGGLQKMSDLAVTFDTSAGGAITVTWTAPIASNITSSAMAVFVIVDETNDLYEVLTPLVSAETVTGEVTFAAGAEISLYGYVLDRHGSMKVASASQFLQVSTASTEAA